MTKSRETSIADARAAIDWLEAHPEIEAVPDVFAGCYYFSSKEREKFVFSALAMGDYELKVDASNRVKIIKRFGTSTIELSIPAEYVGERITANEPVEKWTFNQLAEHATEVASVN